MQSCSFRSVDLAVVVSVPCKRQEGKARREAGPLPGGENLRKSKPKGATGMKQGRKVLGGTKRQEVEKA